MYCMKCGSKIEDGSSFCSECGYQFPFVQTATPINEPTSAPVKPPAPVPPALQAQLDLSKIESPKSSQKPSNKTVWVVAALIGILIIGLCIFFLNRDDKKTLKDGEEILAENDVKDEKDTEESSDDTIEVTTGATVENVSEVATESTEASTDVVAEEEQIRIEDHTKEYCETVIEDLKKQDISVPEQYGTLLSMTQSFIAAKIIDEEGKVLSKMSDGDKLSLDYYILCFDVGNEYSVFYNQVEKDDYYRYDLEETEALFYDTYGCGEIPPSPENSVITVEGDTVDIIGTGGDVWNSTKNASVRELGNYYLVTAPYFFGSNGQNNEEFLGYADVLFVKNQESRFGVTMVYAKAYKGEVQIDHVMASSQLPPQGNNDYEPSNLHDGNYTTVWVEGKAGVGVGETITIYLGEKKLVHGVLLFNGYLGSNELFEKNGKVTAVTVDFGDGENHYYDLYVNDKFWNGERELSYQDYYVGNLYPTSAIITDKIVITIDAAIAGSKYDDTCISELKVY